MKNEPWNLIFKKYDIKKHNFNKSPYIITAKDIKDATKKFEKTSEKEVRILCKQDTREDRPEIFIENNLFLLPIKNGTYAIIKGEGYIDIPEITTEIKSYKSQLDFNLDTSIVGNSEMQHLDFAYASSLIRSFMEDDSLVLTIRGRKFSPKFSFLVGKHKINVESVQTEIDGGYEGRSDIVLIEAKNSNTKNTIIRQLYYPYKQWSEYTQKEVHTLFFEKRDKIYSIWKFNFRDKNDYNSIYLSKSQKFEILN